MSKASTKAYPCSPCPPVPLYPPFNGYTSGFSFGYYSSGEWVNVSSEVFVKDTSLSSNTTKIYERDVPVNSTHFRTTILPFYTDRFYIKTFRPGKIGLIVASEMLSNIADNLTTEYAAKALSAKQGVVLKDMIDGLSDEIFEIRKTPLAIESLETKWGYIGSSNNWVGVSQWRHFVIPVSAGEKYEIVAGANSCAYAFLTEDNAPSSQPSDYQSNPIPVPFVEGYGNVHWMNTTANPQTVEEFIIPSGCNYLYVNKGYGSGSISSNHTPSSVSKVEKVIKGSTDTADNSDTNDTDVYDYPLYNLDGNGFSLPATMQENIAVRKINQVRFTGVPTSGTGSIRYGVPYSSNWEYYRYVGMSVSVYTYLTARANQYSLYNTENINSSASNQSAWGRHYHSTNNASSKFYGNVCCSFTALVAGQPFVINNTDFELGVTQGMLTRVNKPKKVNPYQLKIGDVFNNSGHSFSVYGIKYDGNRDVVAVRIAESTQGRYETNDTGTSYIIIGGIRLHLYSLGEFAEKVDNESFTHYRYNTMPKNLEYEKYATDPTNIQLEDTPQGKAQYTDSNNVTHEYEVGDNDTADVVPVTYSTEICCFAGDKACFPVGELVVVNYALTSGTDISAYDRMKVYKDGVLFDTVLLSDAQQDSLVVSAGQAGHAVNLGESLQAGKYEACLANDSTESDEKTYWEVIDNSTLTLDSAGNLVVDFNKPVKGYWLGTMRDNNDGSYTFIGSKTTCRVATDDELYSQQITIDSEKLAGYTHIRLHIQGEYGMAAVVKPIPVSSENANVEEQINENAGE